MIPAEGGYGLWSGLREWPWDEKEIPRPRTPHPQPALRGQIGDWLSEHGVTTWPQAAEVESKGWRLVQYLAEGNGVHSRTGRPLKLTRSLVLAYFHTISARGATAVLHFKPGAKKDGSGSWRFDVGYAWDICVEIDCEHDRPHTAQPPREASAEEIKALLSEGTK